MISVAPANGRSRWIPRRPSPSASTSRSATGGDLQSIVRLSSAHGPVAGTVTSTAPDSLLFTPAAPLEPNLTYTVTVNGATDLLGHVQTAAFTSSFATPDGDAPVLRLESPLGRRLVEGAAPDGPGRGAGRPLRPRREPCPDARSTGQSVAVTRGTDQFSHVPPADLADGLHTVEASAHDRGGNRGDLVATFRVDSQAPAAATVTVALERPGPERRRHALRQRERRRRRASRASTSCWTGSGSPRHSAASGLSTTWNTVGSAEGAHLITAHAVDVAGNTGPPSAPVRVIVNNEPLVVSITAPDEGCPVRTQVTVAAQPERAGDARRVPRR